MKKILITLIIFLITSANLYAEVIKGEVVENIRQKQYSKQTIPDKKTQITTGAILQYNAGIEYFNMMNYEKSISAFKNAVKQDDRFTDAYFNLGILYEYFQDTKSALVCFYRAYLTNKKDYEALYYVVKCYTKLGDYNAARNYFKKIPTKSDYYNKTKELFK